MSEQLLYPQALATGLVSRLKNENTALVLDTAPAPRSAKRNTQHINYAEFDNDNDFLLENEEEQSSSTFLTGSSSGLHQHQKQHILKEAHRTPHEYFSENDLIMQSDRPEFLVPIRLNIEYNNGNSKLIDFFMWNINEALLTPDQFAKILCNDLDLSSNIQQEISKSIVQQLEDYAISQSYQIPSEYDINAIINLSVNLDKQLFQDKFEWDLNSTLSPESFASIVVADLGLSLEFLPAISHAIHENILRLKKDIVEGSFNFDLKNYAAFNLETGLRVDLDNLNKNWEPIVETLTPWEIEKREIERERNIRRLKRESMRVGDEGASRRRGNYKRRYDELEGTWRNNEGW